MQRLLQGHESCTDTQCVSVGETKCRVIASRDERPDFALEDYYMFEYENVQAVGVKERDTYGWDIAYLPNLEGPIEQYYFCIDTIYNEVWPHWISESAVYLVLYQKLKTLFPTLKMFSISQKKYKHPMYKSFNIPLTDVVYDVEHKRNKFIFPHYISLGDHTKPFLYMKHLRNFYNYIVERCPTKEKDIDILYLPRGKKENSRESNIPGQDYLVQTLSSMPNAKVYFTDDTEDMITQWDTVRRARVILLNEGGNHGINGFFAQDSHIVVMGGHGNGCHFQNPSPALVYYDSVKRGNQYYHTPHGFPPQMVLQVLFGVLTGRGIPVDTPKITCWKNCSYCKYQEYSERPLI